MYLLDTDICIYAIKRRSPAILDKIRDNVDAGLSVSALTIAELEYGISNSTRVENNRRALAAFLTTFTYLAFESTDAIPYGRIKSDLRRRGEMIGPIDLLIAAQAISRDLTLVTNNVREFQRIPELRIENWAEKPTR